MRLADRLAAVQVGDGEEALFLAWERVSERLRALEGLGERRGGAEVRES